jgi:hypothetical protein
MRDAIALFERELARHSGRTAAADSPGFMGMTKQDPESLYDLLLATPENMDSESNSDGSCPPLRECNVLHLSEDGVASIEDMEDDTVDGR